MKKLLFALLVLPSICYADTYTSGTMALLIPSTGVVDSRSWADKYNENFKIISSSFSTSFPNLIAAISIATQTIANSTGLVTVNGVVISSFLITGSGQSTSFNGSTVTVNIPGGAASSTSGFIADLVISTIGLNTTILAASASYIDIQGSLYVNYSTRVNLAIPGAGGVDVTTGTFGTTYAIYAISNAAGTQAGILGSTATGTTASQPTLPTGFTKFRKIGIARYLSNGASSGIIPFMKRGRQVTFWTPQEPVNASSLPSAITTIDLSNLISSSAVNVDMTVIIGDLASTIGPGVRIVMRGFGDGNIATENVYFGLYMNNATEKQWAGTVRIPLFNVPALSYQRSGANEANADQMIIDIQGYEEDFP